MAYKLRTLPTERAYKEEIADFWEIEALKQFGTPISDISILKVISKGFDELQNEGLLSEEDHLSERLEEVFAHIKDRQVFSNRQYPFKCNHASIQIDSLTNSSDYLYVFMLLATRFNMNSDRVQNEIDGTDLFEFISAEAIKNFFGHNSSSFVFGTGHRLSFEKKIAEFIAKVGEGEKFKNPDSNPPTKNDDGIDVVVWKEFADKRKGKLIGFGQCKTGTEWRDGIHKLKPGDFCKKWLYSSPVLTPLPIVFLTDTMNEEYNFISTQTEFLVFNRFRIMEYASFGLSNEIQDKIIIWVKEALKLISK